MGVSVTGLPYPEEREAHTASPSNEEAYTCGAMQLFWQVARRTQPEARLRENADPIVRLCRLVEGHLLAIELAAATARSYPKVLNAVRAHLGKARYEVLYTEGQARPVAEVVEALTRGEVTWMY